MYQTPLLLATPFPQIFTKKDTGASTGASVNFISKIIYIHPRVDVDCIYAPLCKIPSLSLS